MFFRNLLVLALVVLVAVTLPVKAGGTGNKGNALAEEIEDGQYVQYDSLSEGGYSSDDFDELVTVAKKGPNTQTLKSQQPKSKGHKKSHKASAKATGKK